MTSPTQQNVGPTRPPTAVPVLARPFQGTPAGLVSRLLANTVDFCVVAAALATGYLGLAALRFLWNSRTFTAPRPSFAALLLVGGSLMVLYLTVCWAVAGRTYGCHLLGLRVAASSGRRLPAVRALARALLCVAFPIGIFWIPLNGTNRAVHDVVLRSSVVYDWSPARLLL
ncbi:MAG: RDD family protein [Mycobacteriales bacterium]